MNVRLCHWPDDAALPGIVPPEEIQIWLASVPPDDAGCSCFDTALSPQEKARAGRLLVADAQRQYRYSRGLLRVLLGRSLGLAPTDVPLVTSAHGKPCLATGEPGVIAFNLSHTRQLTVLALSTVGQVGVDVERIVDLPDLDTLAELTLTETERAWLTACPAAGRGAAFLHCWTAKEACLKGAGTGLQADPRQIELSVWGTGLKTARLRAAADEGDTLWNVLTCAARAGFVVSVSWPRRQAVEPPPQRNGCESDSCGREETATSIPT